MTTRVIYYLIENENIVYVGKTKNPKYRSILHKKKYPNANFEILDEVPTSEWKFWERHYISLIRSWGFSLDNKKLYAGNGCDSVSEETRKKMSEAQKGNSNKKGFKLSEESKLKISEKSKGNKNCLGKKISPEHKLKIATTK